LGVPAVLPHVLLRWFLRVRYTLLPLWFTVLRTRIARCRWVTPHTHYACGFYATTRSVCYAVYRLPHTCRIRHAVYWFTRLPVTLDSTRLVLRFALPALLVTVYLYTVCGFTHTRTARFAAFTGYALRVWFACGCGYATFVVTHIHTFVGYAVYVHTAHTDYSCGCGYTYRTVWVPRLPVCSVTRFTMVGYALRVTSTRVPVTGTILPLRLFYLAAFTRFICVGFYWIHVCGCLALVTALRCRLVRSAHVYRIWFAVLRLRLLLHSATHWLRFTFTRVLTVTSSCGWFVTALRLPSYLRGSVRFAALYATRYTVYYGSHRAPCHRCWFAGSHTATFAVPGSVAVLRYHYRLHVCLTGYAHYAALPQFTCRTSPVYLPFVYRVHAAPLPVAVRSSAFAVLYTVACPLFTTRFLHSLFLPFTRADCRTFVVDYIATFRITAAAHSSATHTHYRGLPVPGLVLRFLPHYAHSSRFAAALVTLVPTHFAAICVLPTLPAAAFGFWFLRLPFIPVYTPHCYHRVLDCRGSVPLMPFPLLPAVTVLRLVTVYLLLIYLRIGLHTFAVWTRLPADCGLPWLVTVLVGTFFTFTFTVYVDFCHTLRYGHRSRSLFTLRGYCRYARIFCVARLVTFTFTFSRSHALRGWMRLPAYLRVRTHVVTFTFTLPLLRYRCVTFAWLRTFTTDLPLHTRCVYVFAAIAVICCYVTVYTPRSTTFTRVLILLRYVCYTFTVARLHVYVYVY